MVKDVFFERRLTGLTHISSHVPRTNSGSTIAIFDQRSVWLVDLETGDVASSIKLDSVSLTPRFVPCDPDADPLILLCGAGSSDVALLNARGETLWTRPGPEYKCATSGDLDGDGETEFYLGRWRGLERLDLNGRRVWEKNVDTWFTYVGVADRGDGRRPVLVAATKAYELRSYDHSGKVLSRFPLRTRAGGKLCLLQWPSDPVTPHVAYVGRVGRFGRPQFLTVSDLKGNLDFEYAVPSEFPALFGLECTIVRFREEGPSYLAALTWFSSSTGKAMLSLFSLDGRLVYQEILGRSRALAAVSAEHHGREDQVLLVGDSKPRRVVRYSDARTVTGKN